MTAPTRLQEAIDRLLSSIAYRLPRSIAYWCFVRIAADATVYKWPNKTPDEVDGVDLLSYAFDWKQGRDR